MRGVSRVTGLAVLGLLAAACNQVWGIDRTSRLNDAPIDAPRLFVPAPPGPPCGPPPPLESWHYAPHAFADAAVVIHPTFLADDRIIYMYQQHLFEAGVDGGARRLSELEMYAQDAFAAPSAGPTPDAFWFLRLQGAFGGVYLATRASDGTWTEQLADLGIDGYQIQPGTVGFYGGSARMVVAIQATSTGPGKLVEIQSDDGYHWSPIGDLPFDASVSRFDPALSRDGCFLLFATYSATSEVFLSARGADGVFQTPVRIAAIDDLGDSRQPAVSPSMNKVWVVQGGILEGHP